MGSKFLGRHALAFRVGCMTSAMGDAPSGVHLSPITNSEWVGWVRHRKMWWYLGSVSLRAFYKTLSMQGHLGGQGPFWAPAPHRAAAGRHRTGCPTGNAHVPIRASHKGLNRFSSEIAFTFVHTQLKDIQQIPLKICWGIFFVSTNFGPRNVLKKS